MQSYSNIIEYISYVVNYNPVIYLFFKLLYIYFLPQFPFTYFIIWSLYLLSSLTCFTCFLHPLQPIFFL